MQNVSDKMDDTANRRSDANFYHDSSRAQIFQTLITSLFDSIWVSNLIGELSEGMGSLLLNFSFLHHETTKLELQRIMVKSSEVS